METTQFHSRNHEIRFITSEINICWKHWKKSSKMTQNQLSRKWPEMQLAIIFCSKCVLLVQENILGTLNVFIGTLFCSLYYQKVISCEGKIGKIGFSIKIWNYFFHSSCSWSNFFRLQMLKFILNHVIPIKNCIYVPLIWQKYKKGNIGSSIFHIAV